jgi:hypothetical protein
MCVFKFIDTGLRLCHMSQIIGLCYVAGRKAAAEDFILIASIHRWLENRYED